MIGRRSVERVRHPILLGLAEMIQQQVAGDRGNPGRKCTLVGVVAGESAVYLYENILGEILSVVSRARKTIADVVDASMVVLDDFFPGGGVAGDTAAAKHRDALDVFQPPLPGAFYLVALTP